MTRLRSSLINERKRCTTRRCQLTISDEVNPLPPIRIEDILTPSHVAEFDVAIRLGARPDDYVAEVLNSPAGEGDDVFSMRGTEENIASWIGKVSNAAELDSAKQLGRLVFEKLIHGEIRRLWDSCAKIRPLRLRLRLHQAPALSALPWEFMFDSASDTFLSQSGRISVVRHLPTRGLAAESNLGLQSPAAIRLLMVLPNPIDSQPLNVDGERHAIEGALRASAIKESVEIDVLSPPTLDQLEEQLDQKKYEILHFVGHGANDGTLIGAFVDFEDDRRRRLPVSALRLAGSLNSHPTLKLAFLNCCDSGVHNLQNVRYGFASALLRIGIPSVVAMQGVVDDDAAICFAELFYREIGAGMPLDDAILKARRVVFSKFDTAGFGTPSLFIRNSMNYARIGQDDSTQPTSSAASLQGQTLSESIDLPVAPPAANITLEILSPGERYIGRPFTVEFTVINSGMQMETGTVLVTTPPPGLSLTAASDGGLVGSGRVVWNLGELGPHASRKVTLTGTVTAAGSYIFSATATTDRSSSTATSTMIGKGIDAILIDVCDDPDPVELGGSTTYTITVVNQGSAVGTNIEIQCTLPAELELRGMGGATVGAASGKTVTFAALPSLAPKARASWTVTAKAVGVGDVRFTTTMKSAEMRGAPVLETESTHIYE